MNKPLTNGSEFRRTQTLGSKNTVRSCPKLRPSVCRCCQFYTSHGRSGGYCQQLGVSVRGTWHSCPVAISAFAPSWEDR